jgi:hypothetical protein
LLEVERNTVASSERYSQLPIFFRACFPGASSSSYFPSNPALNSYFQQLKTPFTGWKQRFRLLPEMEWCVACLLDK